MRMRVQAVKAAIVGTRILLFMDLRVRVGVRDLGFPVLVQRTFGAFRRLIPFDTFMGDQFYHFRIIALDKCLKRAVHELIVQNAITKCETVPNSRVARI